MSTMIRTAADRALHVRRVDELVVIDELSLDRDVIVSTNAAVHILDRDSAVWLARALAQAAT